MKQRRKLPWFLLSVVLLVMVLFMGMSVTAWAGTAYNSYLVTNSDTANSLQNKVVRFNNIDWYIIEDESTSVNAGTVTLLAADTSFGLSAFDDTEPYSNNYSNSTVKSTLDGLTAEGGSFAGVKDAIADTN